MVADTSAAPSSSTILSISRVAGPESFFLEVATFQIVPSGACTTPPKPHSDFAAGLSVVAPAASAASIRALTLPGCDTVSESVKARKPLVGASEARSCSSGPKPKAVV